MTGDLANLPHMAASAYASRAYDTTEVFGNQLVGMSPTAWVQDSLALQKALKQKHLTHLPPVLGGPVQNQVLINIEEDEKVALRMVKVFIADPDENLPLDQRVLYTGEEKLTDSTDQELFFEIDIKGVLEKHNEARVKAVNKKIKERTEYLEPAKIRDLKMVVVTVATF